MACDVVDQRPPTQKSSSSSYPSQFLSVERCGEGQRQRMRRIVSLLSFYLAGTPRVEKCRYNGKKTSAKVNCEIQGWIQAVGVHTFVSPQAVAHGTEAT